MAWKIPFVGKKKKPDKKGGTKDQTTPDFQPVDSAELKLATVPNPLNYDSLCRAVVQCCGFQNLNDGQPQKKMCGHAVVVYVYGKQGNSIAIFNRAAKQRVLDGGDNGTTEWSPLKDHSKKHSLGTVVKLLRGVN
jgi:hypothetical protein